MALTANAKPDRRGQARSNPFGYPVAPGEKIYTGSLFGVNAAGQAVRIQTAGIVAFVGLCTGGYDNSASAAPGPNVIGSNDTFVMAVAGATMANINANVYATDDATLTLVAPGAGFAGKVGNIAGIENGVVYIKFQGR